MTPSIPALGPGDAHALPTWRAAYSDRTATMMATLCELAYDTEAQIKAAVATGGFSDVTVFAVGDLQAFLAINPAELAVLAFRGTDNLGGWELDLDALRIPLPGHPGVQVHAGFWAAWSQLATVIRAAVDAKVGPDLGLYITGHSLGGAMAQIAAAALERDNLAACYTFGSPRVATIEFDALVKCPHYRVVDRWDLVPAVPPAWPGGFIHSGDPRLLLGAAPTFALRRDRGLLARTLVDLWSLLLWPWTRKLFAVDDHMIWNYRARLQSIAAARNS